MLIFKLIDKLAKEHSLTLDEYVQLVGNFDDDTYDYARRKAVEARKKIYSNKVFIRGLIEISNICKNDCYYCGIRKSNTLCSRYRLTKEEILTCCEEGYSLGFRTFVLQGGEDGYFTDDVLCDIVKSIKAKYPECAVTLSLGERSYDSYKSLKEAGADRYLLRHESITREHYEMLHPENMSYDERVRCLNDLKSLGFQVGCGFMVSSPFMTLKHIANDLKFIEEFKPQMCGIGPFIPHVDTPFGEFEAGSADFTCYLLSIIRLIHPNILLPATTALGSLAVGGREKGIMSGANVIMPNLSPSSVREKYMLYNGKAFTGSEAGENLANIMASLAEIGYETVVDRGDYVK